MDREQWLVKQAEIEEHYNVRVIYAAEWSGPEDIVFCYVRSLEQYCALNPLPESISVTPEIYGWDLKKVLKRIHKPEASVFEWVCRRDILFTDAHWCYVRRAAEEHYSKKAFLYHYYREVRRLCTHELVQPEVYYSDYMKCFRALLACQWMREKNTIPPTEHQILLDSVENADMRGSVAYFENRIRLQEKPSGAALPAVFGYLQSQVSLLRSEADACPEDRNFDWSNLDEIFMQIVRS